MKGQRQLQSVGCMGEKNIRLYLMTDCLFLKVTRLERFKRGDGVTEQRHFYKQFGITNDTVHLTSSAFYKNNSK